MQFEIFQGSYCACIDTKYLSEKFDLIDYRQNCDKLCKDGFGICGDFIENAEFVTVYRTINSEFDSKFVLFINFSQSGRDYYGFQTKT